ncbi:TTC4-like protein [Mya arenaria]|uniref:TTC4-like protein n=1 Tax=Mya arenaria TaxID=6604 RepID=A0ABY7FLS5_MYAAR|nr:TTC4-like protein [Mya arenaria]
METASHVTWKTASHVTWETDSHVTWEIAMSPGKAASHITWETIASQTNKLVSCKTEQGERTSAQTWSEGLGSHQYNNPCNKKMTASIIQDSSLPISVMSNGSEAQLARLAPGSGPSSNGSEAQLDKVGLRSLGSHPAFMKEWDPAVPLSDDMEGLMRLKYEAEDPTGLVINHSFKKISQAMKGIERDKRKEELREKKVKAKETRLLETIQQRGVKMRGLKVDKEGELKMEGVLGVKQGARVTMDANSVLYWPVMLLYPEYSETDFIQMFCESHRLIDHLSHMFGAETEPPHWDPDRRYKPHTVNMYFEDRDSEKLIKVNKESTLSKVLKHKKYVVYDGTPSFFLTVAGSEFEKIFLENDKFA